MDQPPTHRSLSNLEAIAEVKLISGRRIEHERRRRYISQTKLGARARLGAAWIRQLEAGYSKVTLEAHLACGEALGISLLVLFVPMLFLVHGRHFPAHLLITDLRRLELALIECIVNWSVTQVQAALTAPVGEESRPGEVPRSDNRTASDLR